MPYPIKQNDFFRLAAISSARNLRFSITLKAVRTNTDNKSSIKKFELWLVRSISKNKVKRFGFVLFIFPKTIDFIEY